MNFDLGKHTVFLAVAGSHAYGTALPTSDQDVRGVAIPPWSDFVGFMPPFKGHDTKRPDREGDATEPDVVIYDIRHFFRLTANGNPSTMELLVLPKTCARATDRCFEPILANASAFYSRMCMNAFMGYATAQIKRAEQRHRWITAPTEKPRAAHFESTSAYAAELTDWSAYDLWAARDYPCKAEDRRAGYAIKPGLHAVRLLYECAHLLEHGELLVQGPWTPLLRQIRAGEIPYNLWRLRIDELNARCLGAESRSRLPEKPDHAKLNQLCADAVTEFHLDHVKHAAVVSYQRRTGTERNTGQ